MANYVPIRYNKVYANMYIVVGVFTFLIFCFGAIVLWQIENLVYVLAAIGPIYIGLKMHKSNYAEVSLKRIKVYGLFGNLKKDYKLNKESRFSLKSNRLYVSQNNKITKVKINDWFVNQHDWDRAVELFSLNETEKITKHLIDD